MLFINTLPHIPCEWVCLNVKVHRDTPLWLSRQLRMSDLTFKHVIITKIWLCMVFLFLLYTFMRLHFCAQKCLLKYDHLLLNTIAYHFGTNSGMKESKILSADRICAGISDTLFFFSVLYFSSEKYSNFSSLISELYHFTSFYGSFMSSLGDFTKRKLMQSNINNVTRKIKMWMWRFIKGI